MEKKDKKPDPMPLPDATLEEIGEFWDTHSLADYWDETHEVEFQVDLKSDQNETQSDETKPDLPATTEDVGNTELGVIPGDTVENMFEKVTNFLSALDPSTWLARNASKAFGKLCSAPQKWYDAYFEGKATERQSITAANAKITEVVTNQIIQQIKVPPEYAKIAVIKNTEKIIGEQINLDKTCIVTANELQKAVSDVSADKQINEPNRDGAANSSDPASSGREEKTISDVWLNIFETEARPQSTEEGQLLFGRILAGEIRRPGAFSIRALKTLGELDQNIASLFKKLCSVCIVLEHPTDKYLIDVRVPSLGGNPGSNTLKKYGLPFSKLNTLNEYGLIIPEYNSRVDYHVSIADKNNRVLAPFQHQGRYSALLPLPEREESEEFRISGVALSHVGRELFHIVDQDPMPEYAEDLKKYFADQKLQMVEVPNAGPIVVKSIITDTESKTKLGSLASGKIGV